MTTEGGSDTRVHDRGLRRAYALHAGLFSVRLTIVIGRYGISLPGVALLRRPLWAHREYWARSLFVGKHKGWLKANPCLVETLPPER